MKKITIKQEEKIEYAVGDVFLIENALCMLIASGDRLLVMNLNNGWVFFTSAYASSQQQCISRQVLVRLLDRHHIITDVDVEIIVTKI